MAKAADTSLDYISEALRPLAVPIGSIKNHPDNPRKGRVDDIARSLARFGQQRPIVVQDSTGYVVGGNHVLRAARKLGWSHIAINRAVLTDTQARALLMALNRAADLGDYDDEAVLAMIQSITSIEGTGYEQPDVDDLIRRVTGVSEAEAEPKGEGATSNREIVLTMSEGSYAAYMDRLERLRGAYGLDTAAALVYEAVRREAVEATPKEAQDDG